MNPVFGLRIDCTMKFLLDFMKGDTLIYLNPNAFDDMKYIETLEAVDYAHYKLNPS